VIQHRITILMQQSALRVLPKKALGFPLLILNVEGGEALGLREKKGAQLLLRWILIFENLR
jgi:hypothetical protein